MFEGNEFILPLLFAIVTLDVVAEPTPSKYVFNDTEVLLTKMFAVAFPSLYMPPDVM